VAIHSSSYRPGDLVLVKQDKDDHYLRRGLVLGTVRRDGVTTGARYIVVSADHRSDNPFSVEEVPLDKLFQYEGRYAGKDLRAELVGEKLRVVAAFNALKADVIEQTRRVIGQKLAVPEVSPAELDAPQPSLADLDDPEEDWAAGLG
jgi:hypothetical protein